MTIDRILEGATELGSSRYVQPPESGSQAMLHQRIDHGLNRANEQESAQQAFEPATR